MSKVHLTWMLLLLSPSWALAQSKASPAEAAQLFQDASRLQNSGKYAEAVVKWRQFLRDHPRDPAVGLVYQGMGACLVETGEWQAAIDALNEALKHLPPGESGSTVRWNLAIGLYRRAENTKTTDHRKQVAQALENVLADKATSKDHRALAAFYLARTDLALGKTAAAKKRFEGLLNDAANKDLLPPILLALAGLAEDDKDWPRARELYRHFLRDFPADASSDEARLGLADVLLQQGQYQEADTLFGQLVKRPGLPAADYAAFRWAELAELRGDRQTAAKRWTAFLDKHPKSSLRERALRRAGEIRFQLEEFSLAAAAFSTWLEENPAHEARATTQVQLGLALIRLEKIADAEKQLKAALPRLEDTKARNQALLGLARSAAALKRPEDSVKYFAELFASKTAVADMETTKLEAVAAAFAASKRQEGLAWTDQMVKSFAASPWTSQAQLQAARYLTEHAEFEAALERSKWILEAKVPEAQPPALYLAGFCAMKLRKFADAITFYQRLRDDHPQAEQAPVAAYSLGVAFESQGATAKALTAYQVFLKRYADHSLAAEAKKRIRILKENR